MENNHHPHYHKEIDYNSFTAEDGNVVWAGALTLAWKELLKLAQPHASKFHLKGGSQDIQQIADNFNHSPFSTKDLEDSSYYVKSGYGQGTVETINKERAQKFKECTMPPVEANVGDSGIISYAYLYKKVMYPYKFNKRQDKSFEFKGKDGLKQVQTFYAEDTDQLHQVRLYDYKSDQDFVVRLQDRDDKDEIYLYKTGNESVKDAIDHVSKLSVNDFSDKEFIMQDDKFQVPILNLDYQRTLSELIGAQIQEMPGYTIEDILQGVKLKLDESGAIVENEGLMMINECAILNTVKRELKFNSPFWVVMKEKDRHPYLCIRINNL